LFWSWLMSAFASAVTLRKWDRDREFLPWVIVVSLVTLLFFVFLSVFFENPFLRYFITSGGAEVRAMFQPAGTMAIFPPDGQGLNPLLRHPGMIIHPPMLYLGFVAFVIPFAFGIAALVTGRSDDRWIRITRRWTLVAWLFLSLGLLLGSRWAYDVLGWGGYWAWDPVEIAAFMPWLSGTAFLHSAMIQEKRGLFKRWNMILVMITYALVIYGTFLVRSGVLNSVHSFARSSIGPLFFVFISFTLLSSMGLVIFRWKVLRSEDRMTSFLSRESLFLFNNLLFMGILVVCFWGVNFPIISEIFTGNKVTVGPPFYKAATGPLFLVLLVLMGVAPLSAWGFTSVKVIGKAIWKPLAASAAVMIFLVAVGIRQPMAIFGLWLSSAVGFVTLYDYWRGIAARMRTKKEAFFTALWRLAGRNRRRYGGYIIHLGVVLMAIGIIGIESFQTQTQGTLTKGESLKLDQYTVTFDQIQIFDTNDGRNVARAETTVTKNGNTLITLYPRRDFYIDSQQPMTIPGVYSTIEDDVYVLLVDWEPISSDSATFKIYHNPLINWLWAGGLVFLLGTMVATWPTKEDTDAVRLVAASN
ncbi:MAG: heme lyase CcmF/NrfE family subunit, partial [Anaerolineaceae bacterium]|nr:heme lyase CcmF/NrfE family subunit [Anaerolineaceae bacterium]